MLKINRIFAVLFLYLMLSYLDFNVESVHAIDYCDWAEYVTDVSIPDGTVIEGGASFTKTWRLRNIGTCTWTTDYTLSYRDGDMMSAPARINLPHEVAPGQTVDLSVQMIAPTGTGHYIGYWWLHNAKKDAFGVGLDAKRRFWVDINVKNPTMTVYDFTVDECSAMWFYDGGPIPCPLNPNKLQYGSVYRQENPLLENGSAAGQPGLLTIPHNKYNGMIIGYYPVFDILQGDHFQALVGCEYQATGCYVTFELGYYVPGQVEPYTIWRFRERYDGLNYPVDIDLSRYSGKKNMQLVLKVYAQGPVDGDRPLWIAPRIVREVKN